MSQQPDNLYETYLRSLRFQLLSKLDLPIDDVKILDIGCADGSMWKNEKHKYLLDGIDVDDQMLKSAKESGIYNNLSLSIDSGAIENYDVVVCFGVLEHVDEYWDLGVMLKDAKRLILTVPNAWSFHRIVGVHLGHILEPDELHAGDIAIGHKRVFDPHQWRAFITTLAADGKFSQIYCGSIGMKFTNSLEMINFSKDQWEAFDETADDLELCGNNCFYGAELYAILGRD